MNVHALPKSVFIVCVAVATATIFLDSPALAQECAPANVVRTRRAGLFGFWRRSRINAYPAVQSYPVQSYVSPTPAMNCQPATTVHDPATMAEPAADPIADQPAANVSDAVSNSASVIPTPATSPEPDAKSKADNWRSMFDGKELGEWAKTKFGGEGDVLIEDGAIKLDYGQYMTGITYTGKHLPNSNYEIELEAMREEGSDFFCGLTFPVKDKHLSLIIGGWGGSVVGISSLDDMDASENNSTAYMNFKNKQWYKIRLRVLPEEILAWIDDKEVVNVDIKDRRLSTRIEVDLCKPLGIASFDTQSAIRSIKIREIN